MTPAELLVTRKACGRSNAWLADACGVDLRTAQRWQSPKRWQDVPEFAAEIARAELAVMDEMADYECSVLKYHPSDRRVIFIDRDEPRTIAVAWRVLERFPDCEIQFRANDA